MYLTFLCLANTCKKKKYDPNSSSLFRMVKTGEYDSSE